VVDPREHIRIGTMDYAETLPLLDHEVVLTFDDGPIPPYTGKVLDILAAECVKATYFIVGTMAREYPSLVRRAYDNGHTIGTHSMSHPLRFRALSVERANAQIDDGIAATAAALGDPDRLAPFFRFPGFGHTGPAHEHAASRGLMVWGADVPADDWHRLGPQEVARRAVQRLEYKGKGILLLHDIHQRTVDALPLILKELKQRGFRVVHVVPASAAHPATVTTAEAWLPHSRPRPAAPVIMLAALQDLGADILMKKSAEELCSMAPPYETVGRATRRHTRMAGIAHAEAGQAKPRQAKAKPAKMAHADRTAATPDVHAVQ
jgi:peptidoglycan-N-acetylglucosamine deacetylase